jgi:NAD(P)-dependent dehydrogenase (short-subunit alcohol dehydrogenase family)
MRRVRLKRGAAGRWGRWLRQGGGVGGVYLGWRLFQLLRAADLHGQVVLITGGSRGLGLALARQFAREGCRIALCARDEQELERAREAVAQVGVDVFVRRCDVTDRDAVEELVKALVAHFGHLDVVVNNAGIIQVGPFDVMTPGDFERAMAANFWGPLHVVWAALPYLRERGGGRIVNITSIGGEVAVPHLLPYDCAKAAFLKLSEGLQAELSAQGTRVTTIVPGLMRTGSPVNASFKGDAQREFEWFSLGDSLALTSMSPERAARKIVASARRGEGKVVLSWQAKLLRMAQSLAPNLVSRALALVNRGLPGARGLRFEARRGQELTPLSSARRNLHEAARRLNQYGATPTPVSEPGLP